MPILAKHMPNGASPKQFVHYAQEFQFGFFGQFMNGTQVPQDFPLSRITTPLGLHWSPTDEFTNPKDFHRLVSKLNNSALHIQTVDEFKFLHLDFIWSPRAVSLVYDDILNFLRKH